MVDAVDLAANEDADPAVTPLAPVGQQEWNEQSQTCKRKHTPMKTSDFLWTFFILCLTAYYKLGSQEGLRTISAVTDRYNITKYQCQVM